MNDKNNCEKYDYDNYINEEQLRITPIVNLKTEKQYNSFLSG